MFSRSLVALLVVPLLIVACGDDHDHDDGHKHGGLSDACTEIVEACHFKDTGDPGPINDCHTKAHDNSSECESLKAQCVSTCDAAPLANPDAG